MNLRQLPTTFIEQNLRVNPTAKIFSWGSTREDLEAELRMRRLEEELKPFLEKNGTLTPTFLREVLTVVIFTSPIPSHPDPWIINDVCRSIRQQLHGVELVVLADGTPGPEPASYTEYKRIVNVIPSGTWKYQTGLIQYIKNLTTPLVLVVEHDTGFRNRLIDWKGITDALTEPSPFGLIQIRPGNLGDWELTRGKQKHGYYASPVNRAGVTLLPTHLFQPVFVARRNWLEKLLPFLTEPQHLEGDQMHEALLKTGMINEMASYIPEIPNSGRLYHLDGRSAAHRFEVDKL